MFEPPISISLNCKACGKETTWQRETNAAIYNVSPFHGYVVTYQCALCSKNKESITVFVRTIEMMANIGWPKKVQKIGQFPPQSIEIAGDLEKRLGDSAELYKNALICRNFNFGVGALAYIRRVIENKTNELIEVIAEQAESYGEGDAATSIRAAKDERMTFDERLRLAGEAIPSALRLHGANPLAALYELLSNGLHAQSETDCIVIADEIRDVFEYVFARLRAEIEERSKVMSKVKKWLGSRGPKPAE